MPAVSDIVWSAQATTPGDIEAALRAMLKERHSENASYVPARTLNLVCIVDKQWSGEIANRLRQVGRSHAARTIVCAVEPKRTTMDAVGLAWLRPAQGRGRLRHPLDPPHLRPDLRTISAVTVRHQPESGVAALLLMGWLASRLDWRMSPLMARDGKLVGSAHARRQDVRITLEPAPDLQVRGLAGLTLETASGRHFELDRGPGGLQAYYRNAKGQERRWVVLGASRGEPGILGEGIRQALLRDPTYAPALEVACAAVR